MKTSIINSQCRDFPEFKSAIYQDFLNCQTIAKIEPHESTADLLMKTCEILSKKGVKIYIDWTQGKGDKPGTTTIKFIKSHIKHTKTFTEGIDSIHDLEFYVLKELLFFED